MKIKVERIIEIHNKIQLTLIDGYFLREDLFLKDLLFSLVKFQFLTDFPNSYFPRNRTPLPKRTSGILKRDFKKWEELRKKLPNYLNQILPFKLKIEHYPNQVKMFVLSHLIESLYALERSIFWFFNYRHNLIPGHEVASDQALYYSEFFIKLAILKFLGFSIVHTKFGNFKVEIEWYTLTVNINHYTGSSSEHLTTLNNFLNKINDVDLKPFPIINSKFKPSSRNYELLGVKEDDAIKLFQDSSRSERMKRVYDLTSRFSDPFKYSQSSPQYLVNKQDYCFFNGYERYYEPPPYPNEDYDVWFNTTFIPDYYGSWGIYEHNIGQLMKFLISNIRKIQKSRSYFKILKSKLENLVNYDEEVKEIILNWID